MVEGAGRVVLNQRHVIGRPGTGSAHDHKLCDAHIVHVWSLSRNCRNPPMTDELEGSSSSLEALAWKPSFPEPPIFQFYALAGAYPAKGGRIHSTPYGWRFRCSRHWQRRPRRLFNKRPRRRRRRRGGRHHNRLIWRVGVDSSRDFLLVRPACRRSPSSRRCRLTWRRLIRRRCLFGRGLDRRNVSRQLFIPDGELLDITPHNGESVHQS